ncbi:SusC/RagA family TonB-linked outer membrane protein [Carboxylicivirga sp. RSCT41]|uniref:SusC/RagA family TonB-linked outer membrane protein n=1 Tax=Carboxylicivirga agarovorans TaxID=3417570 RepID=UPI003D3457F3
MRISFVLLMTVMLQVSATSLSQNKYIDLKVNNVSLVELFKIIQTNTDYDFFYQPSSLPHDKVITADYSHKNIEDILTVVLEDTDLDYKIVDTDIVILERNNPHADSRSFQDSLQQDLLIKGVVKDASGEPLPGVNVFNKANPTNGVITDYDGNFVIEIQSPDVELTFSYIGFISQTRSVKGINGQLIVTLISDVEEIDEVVVTALGIKKEEKVLGYAMQQVGKEELTEAGNPNVVSALQGKVAGVEITTAATGLGGSSKITIRGNSSIAGNNDPLWVVDGVPFNNNGTDGPGTYGGYDRGTAAMDLNMDDVESISVLKGPNAAALYGSLAGNGVIIVTTKRGSDKKGLGVDFSATLTIEDVAESLDMQNTYGRGFDGLANATSTTSWGSEMDGSLKESWIGQELPYLAQTNRMEEFFKTGITQNYTVAIGNKDEDKSYRLGTSYLSTDGIFDNQSQERLNIDVSGATRLSEFLSIDSKVSLSETVTRNRTFYGTYGAVNQLLQMPRNIRLQDLTPYGNEERQHINWTGGAPTIDFRNPYYVNDEHQNEEVRDRVFGYVRLYFEFGKLANLSFKQSLDYYNTKFENKTKDEGLTPHGTEKSSYSIESGTYKQFNTEVLLTGQKLFNKLDFSYIAGFNRMYYSDYLLSTEARNLKYMDFNLGAGQDITRIPFQSLKEKEVQSVFGSAQFYYNSFLNLELTARNDWSSALPADNNSYFYPSVNLGFIGTSLMDNVGMTYPGWIDFAKLRMSWAQVGKDCAPHQLENARHYERDSDGNLQIKEDSNIRYNSDLKPEMTTSKEIGFDLRMFKNRIGFDFTYYNAFTKNQILLVDEIKSSGYEFKYINAGKITNKGVELAVYLTPIKTRNFIFNLDFNYANREDYVDELDKENSRGYQTIGENPMLKVIAKTGAPLGQILAKSSYLRNENGDVVINEGTDLPQVLTDKSGEKVIGCIQPDWTGSIRPSFSYKNVTLSSLFNIKQGGDVVSVSESIATYAGTSKRTENREAIIYPGVVPDGNGGYVPNTKEVSAQKYYRSIGNMGGVGEEFVYDASFIKWGELSLSYTLGKNVLSKLPFDHLKISFIGRNLSYLLKHTPGTSPEAGFNMFSQAHDFSSVPYTRSFGFSINARF